MGILEARKSGHVPIVVPRLRSLGEVVDDHQVAFCRHLAESGDVLLAEDEVTLSDILDRVVATPEQCRVSGASQTELARPGKAIANFSAIADELMAQARPARRLRVLQGRPRSDKGAGFPR